MAVLPEYQVKFKSQTGHDISITFKHANDANDTVTQLPVVAGSGVGLYYGSSTSSKFDCIVSCEAKITLFIAHDNYAVDFTTFLTDSYNQWKVTITENLQTVFQGYLIPEEGRCAFKAKPYVLELRATDGLGLLKEVPFTNPDGENYDTQPTNFYSLIHFISTALRKTNLDLDIRTRCNIYHFSHVNRYADITRDMFDQTFLNYRTFQKSATEYVSAYDVLMIMLENNFTVYQAQGRWNIDRIEEKGFTEDGNKHYTIYSYDGESIEDGNQIFDTACNIEEKGQLQMLAGTSITWHFPVKEVTTKFEFKQFPELPRNNKFERGDFVDESAALDETDENDNDNYSEVIGTCKRYEIDDWQWGTVDLNNDPAFPLDSTTTDQPLIKKIYNTFGVEVRREVSLPFSTIADGGRYASALRSEAIPVIQGDKISFSIEQRYDSDIANETSIVALVYLVSTSGRGYYLSYITDQVPLQGTWRAGFIADFVSIEAYFGDSDARQWTGVSVDSEPIPVNGDLYIMLLNKRTDSKTAFFRNLSLDYYPKIGGSFQSLEGGAWITSQNKEIKSEREDTVRMSDCSKPVIQGTLSHSNGQPMNGVWYRLNAAGGGTARTYTELQNLSIYTENYKRYDRIEGYMKGLMCSPSNNTSVEYPIGFEHTYKFTDSPIAAKTFVMVPPLSIDLVTGISQVNFVEVSTTAPNDGDTHEFKYLF